MNPRGVDNIDGQLNANRHRGVKHLRKMKARIRQSIFILMSSFKLKETKTPIFSLTSTEDENFFLRQSLEIMPRCTSPSSAWDILFKLLLLLKSQF